MSGAYNAVSPDHVNNNEFIRTLARVMNIPVFLPPVPAVIFRAAFGEMSAVILKGSRISSEKILSTGYNFIYPDLEDALTNAIYSKD
jgi:NAD dependent epimerase/dehydratase family enzyme